MFSLNDSSSINPLTVTQSIHLKNFVLKYHSDIIAGIFGCFILVRMSNSLADLLASRKREEPAEIAVIKQFVMEKFSQPSEILLQEKQIVIGVKGAALAGALRPLLPELQGRLNTDKRLLIRIK